MHHFHSSVHKTEPQTYMGRCQGHTASMGDIKWLVGKVIDRQSPPVMWSLTGRWSLKEKAYMYPDELCKICSNYIPWNSNSREEKTSIFRASLSFSRLRGYFTWVETREVHHGVTLRKQFRRNSARATNERLPGYYAVFWGKQLQYSK